MSNALAGQPLEEVVRAMAAVARTLSALKGSHGLAHRDVKPGNLYWLDGRWLVGDFGLVAVPDVEELTKSDRPMGPVHFTAYEMIVNPAHADPFPADVFSLAKTLWVLAVDQRFPPAGTSQPTPVATRSPTSGRIGKRMASTGSWTGRRESARRNGPPWRTWPGT